MLPKDPPVKDPEFMLELKRIIGRCEWPDGCHRKSWLDCCHIRARGMGGGRRKDTEDNLVILCREHHIQFDQSMGQSRRNQDWMRQSLGQRTDGEKRKIRSFLRAREA